MQNTRVRAAGASDEHRLSLTTQLVYASGSVGTGAFYAFNNFVLPPVLKGLGAPDLLIGLLSSTRSIEGALIQPTVGALSDRLRTPLGRRRPFLLIGVPLSALCFVAAAFARDLAGLGIMIVAFSFFFNLAVDPYTALLADITPLHQRGWLSGLATAVQLVSSVVLLLLVVFATAAGSGVPVWLYVAVAVLMLASFAVTFAGIREPRSVAPHARPGMRAYVEALLEQRQALRYLGTLFVYQFGLNAILPYLVLFVVEDIGQTQQVAFALSAALLVVTGVSAAIFGKLGDRVGTRRILAFGWFLLAGSALAGVFVRDLQQTEAVVLVAGAGNGAATAVSWPLLTALIPSNRTGVFAGLKAAAESIATPVSVVVAAEVFLPWLGYRGIFAMLAVAILTALILLLCFVHVPRSVEPEPAAILVPHSRGGEIGETRRT